MYKHILVPTDGSALSNRAIRAAVKLARNFRARITGVHVIPPYTPPVYGEAAVYVADIGPRRYREMMEKAARRALAVLEKQAKAARVRCKTRALTTNQPWQGILRTARSRRCDVIVMASHGRRGLTGLLLGSETTKVLTHSKIPVLVCR